VISREVTIGSRIGLHGRPAAAVVDLAAGLPVPVHITMNGRTADARSIISVLALGARGGDVVTVHAEGDTAEGALDTVVALLARDLDAEPGDV